MHPEEAIGLIARCKQIIIVGDQKQLPPDNRWKTSLDDEDDDYTESVEMDINESILELNMLTLQIAVNLSKTQSKFLVKTFQNNNFKYCFRIFKFLHLTL